MEEQDKTYISDSSDERKVKEYWWSRTPQEHMQELERLRRIAYGDKATERIQKILEIVKYE